MQVELIGATGSGKSTLADDLCVVACADGRPLMLGSDFLLKVICFCRIRNKVLRAVLLHVVAAFGCCLGWRKYWRFIAFCWGQLHRPPISRWHRWNQFRKVLKQLGCFVVVARDKCNTKRLVIVDEGTVHAAHNVFVHVGTKASQRDLSMFADTVPLPDVIVCVCEKEELVVERTIGRGHPRIPTSASRETVVEFVREASDAFQHLAMHNRIASRTIIVDGLEIITPSDPCNVEQVNVVRDVLCLALARRLNEDSAGSSGPMSHLSDRQVN